MKQKLLNLTRLRSLLLLACVMLGVSAWGETATWPGTTALPGELTSVGNSPIQIKVSSTNTYSNPIRVYSGTTITIQATTGYVIQSVTYEASSTGNYVTIAKEATVRPLVTPTVSSKNVTWSYGNNSETTEFTFTPSAQTRCNSITITYKSLKLDPQIAFNPATVTINQGETLPSISFLNPNSVSNITFTSNNTALATVSNAGEISLEPDATGTATITASFAGNDSYAAKTVTCVITVIPLHTAHFFVNGIELTSAQQQIAEGSDITFPNNLSDINGKTFIGWTATALDAVQDDAPTMVSSATMENADINFYAVYATGVSGSETITLTNSVITGNASGHGSYSNTYNIDGWTGRYMINNNSGSYSLQLGYNADATKSAHNSHLTTPVCESNIISVTLNTTNGTASGRTFYLCNATDIGCATSEDAVFGQGSTSAANGSVTIPVEGNTTQLHIYPNGTAYLASVSLAVNSTTYSDYCTTIPPLTVAEALETANDTEVYVRGIVSRVDGYNSNDRTMNYWISDDGTYDINSRLGIHAGKGVDGADFTSISDVRIGDVVVLRGTLGSYNSTKELQQSQIVTLTVKEEPGIAYATASYTVGYNAAFTTPVLTNPNGLTVTYSSDNQGVATVNAETGDVTILSTAGTATVTATYAGGEYRYATASYTITVEPKIYITMNADGIMTYASTYGLDFSQVEGLTAYFASGYNKDNLSLTMTEVTYTAPGAGMMLKGEAEHVYLVPIATEGSTTTANLLVGLTQATTVSQVQTENDETFYTFILAKVNNVINWYKLAEESYPLRANIAYLKLPAAAIPSQPETDQVIMDFSGGSNGISTATATATNNESWYTLDGRLLQGKPATKGIYVNNGRKIVIK